MNPLEYLSSLPIIQALGWTLLHFLWQGALVAAAVGLLLSVMRRRSPNARYVACCAGMALMIAAPLTTLGIILTARYGAVAIPPELLAADLGGSSIWHRLAPLLPYLTLFWLAGVLLLQCRLILQWSRAQHLKHCGTRSGPPAWDRTVAELSERLRVGKHVRIVESLLAPGPMMMGWLRPVILLPVGVATGLTVHQLRTVIAHELAHVRRHDYIVNLIQSVFETLLFYHPAVWWLSHRLRVEREYCCDDLAVSACGDALCYARALSALDGMRGEAFQTALATTGGPLMNRILRVVGLAPKAPQRVGGWLAPMVIAASITAAASIMLLAPGAAAGEKIEKGEQIKIVQKVDVVAIAKKAGVKRADVLAELQAAGLDNEALMIVLREIEPDPNVIKKVELIAQETATKKVALTTYEKQLIEKMKAQGASKEEVKDAIAKLRAKQGNPPVKVKVKDPKAEYMAYEEQVIKKMKADGASDEELKKTITKMRADFEKKMAPEKKVDLAAYEEQLIEKMKAEGASKQEIKEAIAKLRAKHGNPPVKVKMDDPKAEYMAYEEQVIKKMKADGASEQKIKKTITKMWADFEKKMAPEKKVDLAAYEKKLIEKMKADGASKEEIKEAIAKLRAKEAPPVKKVSTLSKKEQALIEKMKAAGMSKEEISRVLAELRAR